MDFDIARVKGLNDSHLVKSTHLFVNEERKLLAVILHHLREIQDRRLFSDYGYKSLHEMCVKEFKYSDDQSYRRCQAMRLLYELPQIEEKIQSGELTLKTMNLAGSLFRQEGFDKTKKLEIINQISGKSSREAERITLSLSSKPEMLKPDRITQVTQDKVEMKFMASRELEAKIQTLKGRYAHKKPNMSLGELFEELCDQALKTAPVMKPRGIREVFARAKQKCEICQSSYALESDHVIPKAKGGSDEQENRRALCRNCNQRAAIRHFGFNKMSQYLQKP